MQSALTALIIDDEANACRLLCKLLEELRLFSEIRLAGSFSAALNELSQFDPDMIFLDIRMPGKDGFALIAEMPVKKNVPELVIVTAYDQYAMKAIKSHAFDYLLKPVNRKELKQCILKYIEKRALAAGRPEASKDRNELARIKINTRTGTVFLNPSSILYCKADGNYTMICTGDKQHLCSLNLGKVEELLPSNGFIRIGRSYVINLEFISFLDRKDSSVVLERNGESFRLKVSRQHLKDLDSI